MSKLLVLGNYSLIEVDYEGSVKLFMGGAAYNIALAARSSDVEVHGVACLGDDLPEEMRDNISRLLPCVDFVFLEGECGRFKFNYTAKELEPGIISLPGVSRNLTNVMLDYLTGKLVEPNWIHLCCRTPLLADRVLDVILKQPPPVLSIDFMFSSIATQLSCLKGVEHMVDWVFVNQGEYDFLKKSSAVFKAIFVTKGPLGASIIKNDCEVHSVPGIEVSDVIETSGAGDSFAGGAIATLMKGGSELEALRVGVELGARAVSGFGVSCIEAAAQ